MSLDPARHKNTLVRILREIYTDTALGPVLGFKGGTAAYLFYGLKRLSLDLDFDLLEGTAENKVFEKIRQIAGRYGKVKQARRKRFNLFFLLSYEDAAPNIKLEVNLREFGSRYEVKSYLGIAMKVMTAEDMLAHKLVAIYERVGKANRDIFDVWFFLKHDWRLNKRLVEQRVNMSCKDFLSQCILALENLPNRGILSGMGELLEEPQKAWVRDHLKEETIFLLKLRLEAEKERPDTG